MCKNISVEAIQATWNRVNYNAKNSKGEYVCRNMTCYSPLDVENVLCKLNELNLQKELTHQNVSVVSAKIKSALTTKLTAGQIGAILYEFHTARYENKELDKAPNDKDTPIDWQKIGIIVGAAGVLVSAIALYYNLSHKGRRK